MKYKHTIVNIIWIIINIYFLIYTSLSLILKNFNSWSVFFFMASIFLLIISTYVHKFIKLLDFTSLLLMLFFFRLMFALLSTSAFTKGLALISSPLKKITGSLLLEEKIITGLVFILTIFFIGFMVEYFYRIIINLSLSEEPKSKNEKILSYVDLAGALLSSLIIPHVIFGISYLLILYTFYSIELNIYEAIYLSFVINYTLPVSGDIIKIFNAIDTSNSLRLLEVAQIIIGQILDLTVIAFIISYINDLINKVRLNNKN